MPQETMKTCPATGTIAKNEPAEPLTGKAAASCIEKFFGKDLMTIKEHGALSEEPNDEKSAFECALIRNEVEYITNSLGGIVINRDDMDVELYGDMIGGYDLTGVRTATIPHSEIK